MQEPECVCPVIKGRPAQDVFTIFTIIYAGKDTSRPPRTPLRYMSMIMDGWTGELPIYRRTNMKTPFTLVLTPGEFWEPEQFLSLQSTSSLHVFRLLEEGGVHGVNDTDHTNTYTNTQITLGHRENIHLAVRQRCYPLTHWAAHVFTLLAQNIINPTPKMQSITFEFAVEWNTRGAWISCHSLALSKQWS